MSEPVTLDQLVAFLREEEKRSYDMTLADERSVALDFYNGKPFGDEEKGRSQVVTRDVAEVIDYMTVSTLRTMVSGDRVVEFECDDKAVAEQATLAVSREFFQGQRGYQFLHDWIKAALLEKASIAKCCVEPQPGIRREAVMQPEEMAAHADAGAQFIAAAPVNEGDPLGAHHVAWIEPQPPRFRDYVTPNESVSFAQDATDLDDDCVYVGFHHWRTLSQLAQLGFDTDGLGDNASLTPEMYNLAQARDDGANQNRYIYNRSGPNRRVIHHEEYVRFDLDGDGIAEQLLVHRVRNTILKRKDGSPAIEVIDEQPGVSWCPFPMQHRIVGQSLADKVMDIQRISSVLMRQALDNLYQSNAPRWTISESSLGDSTIDDLLTVRAGGLIRYAGAVAPVPVTLPFSAQASFEALEIMRGDRESRTGITRMNQGLDADALNKTATGTALMQASGQQIEEYVARNFAEAFARLMLKKYRLMRQFGQPFQMVIDDQPVTVDPRQWPETMQVQVRVGLGTGRKEQRIAYRQFLLQATQPIMQAGLPVISAENLYNNLKGLVADMALGAERELLTDPASIPPQPPPPDPETVKAQAQAGAQVQVHQAKVQSDAALQQQKAQLDAVSEQRKLEHDFAIAEVKARADVEREQARAQADIEIARERNAHEFALELSRQAHEMQLAEQKLQEARLSKPRPGGALDA